MAISTYTELLTAAGNWLSRADLSSRIPEFVTLAQARINRQVRARVMETKSTSITIDAEYEDVPADFLEVKHFYITSSSPRRTLQYMPAEQMTDFYSVSDDSKYFTVSGTQFRFAPPPSGSYTATLVYYAKPATLATTTQETNSLFPANADLYLYASLLEAESFIQNDPRLAVWKAAYDEALHNLNKGANNSRYAGAMVTRPDSSTP
jgi:hypothetical protein